MSGVQGVVVAVQAVEEVCCSRDEVRGCVSWWCGGCCWGCCWGRA